MTIEQLKKDLVIAMKKGDEIEKSAIRTLIAAATNAAIAKNQKDNITEEIVDAAILKEKKTLEEMVAGCPKERTDLLEQYMSTLCVINHYAPTLMNDPEEIRAIVVGELAAAGIEATKANKGLVMKTLMPLFKGKADMKIVNQVIGEELQ
jgi:uncharacterized protein YqeY